MKRHGTLDTNEEKNKKNRKKIKQHMLVCTERACRGKEGGERHGQQRTTPRKMLLTTTCWAVDIRGGGTDRLRTCATRCAARMSQWKRDAQRRGKLL